MQITRERYFIDIYVHVQNNNNSKYIWKGAYERPYNLRPKNHKRFEFVLGQIILIIEFIKNKEPDACLAISEEAPSADRDGGPHGHLSRRVAIHVRGRGTSPRPRATGHGPPDDATALVHRRHGAWALPRAGRRPYGASMGRRPGARACPLLPAQLVGAYTLPRASVRACAQHAEES